MTLAYSKENALNAICPYFTMFPLEYPLKVLKKHQRHDPVVLDPFCGRGTTLFAARNLGLRAWGIDSSPVAVAIAQAKLASCEHHAPLDLAAKILRETTPLQIPDNIFFQHAYHSETLLDICKLREALCQLNNNDPATIILRAAILGCLHGPLPKNLENSGYFSNQMPRTYASKPDYAVRFWNERHMTPPRVDVLKVLRRKIERLTGLADFNRNSLAQVIRADAQTAAPFRKILTPPSVIVTSPPYYGMKTYVQDQWLRNWFLGGASHVDYSAGLQLEHGGKQTFSKSLAKVWSNIGNSEAATLHMYIRFGIIPSANVNAKEIFQNSLEESSTKWRLVSTRKADTAQAGKRQADQMKARSTAAVELDFHVERIE